MVDICIARDTQSKRYDVELQQEEEGASARRARYHSGLLDMNTLEAGQDFDELPESYVIFITRDDVLGYGLPIYHINKKIEEVREDFQDGAHIIYVNAKIKDKETALGRLMHDLQCRTADEMFGKVLAERVRELKETPKGVEDMCREMDEIYNEGMEIGETRGEQKAKKETAMALASMGMSIDKISQVVKESMDQIQQWLAEGGGDVEVKMKSLYEGLYYIFLYFPVWIKMWIQNIMWENYGES